MKAKNIPPLIIMPSEKPGYVVLVPKYDDNKVIVPCTQYRKVNSFYLEVKIVRTEGDNPDEAITPIAPYTPNFGNKPFYHAETKNYYFYHPKHNCVRPIKDSAPNEAPPPIPDKVECIG